MLTLTMGHRSFGGDSPRDACSDIHLTLFKILYQKSQTLIDHPSIQAIQVLCLQDYPEILIGPIRIDKI